jgi:hypothetical protein
MTKPSELPLEELRGLAEAEEASYARGEASDDTAGLELFRRAIENHDEAAWRAVTDIYRGMLTSLAGRRVVRGLVSEDNGFCVDRAFERFWRATHNGRVHQFDDLASVLKYLKMCLGSVLLDEARARRRQAWVSIDTISPQDAVCPDQTTQVLDRVDAHDLWRAIYAELPDAHERLVAQLSFVAGMSPREILDRHPETFRDVFDVYRTKRNMVDRLRRSRSLQERLG